MRPTVPVAARLQTSLFSWHQARFRGVARCLAVVGGLIALVTLPLHGGQVPSWMVSDPASGPRVWTILRPGRSSPEHTPGSASGPQSDRDRPAFSREGEAATIIPDHVPALQWTSLQLVYEVGSGGMAEGGGIRVQFPKSWHRRPPAPTAPQTTDRSAPYYVTAQTSAPEVDAAIGVAYEGIDGRTDYLDWTATLALSGGSLVAGELITYTFGDQSYGSAGVRAVLTALTEQVRVAVDPEGDGEFGELSNPPELRITPWKPCRLAVHVPSRSHPGTPFELHVTAQDQFTNPSDAYTGTIRFQATDPLASLPCTYTFSAADAGRHVFPVTLYTPGIHWITVTDERMVPGGQPSNPTDCSADTAAPNVYWGDLHSHTEFSLDAIGPLSQALDRVRDQLGLDFYAATDHIQCPTNGLTPEEWQATRDLLEDCYLPGVFVPILAYEWSKPAPYGHHNVYFPGGDGPLCYLDECNTLDKLWARLEDENALTIAHHTGVCWLGGECTVDWSYNRPELRTSIEIFSVHGQSELYDPAHPLSYEARRPGAAWSVDGPHYARDAWAAGHRIGVVAGSDSHDLRPGLPGWGLTAICTDALTREGLLDAIRARHTYATTGERILLDFTMGQAMMGDLVGVPLSAEPVFDVRVAGTAAIDWVELVRFDGSAYTVAYRAMPAEHGDRRRVAFRYKETAMPSDSLYYVRLQQIDPDRPERPAMAWSSPIWVERIGLYVPLVHR